MHSSRHAICVLACLLSGAGGLGVGIAVDLSHPAEIGYERAVELAGESLTPRQLHIVATVLHRHGLDVIAALDLLAREADPVGPAAREAIQQIHDRSRR